VKTLVEHDIELLYSNNNNNNNNELEKVLKETAMERFYYPYIPSGQTE